MNTLDRWNHLQDRAAAAAEVLPCNGSPQWAAELAAHPPFRTPDELLEASDRIWRSLPLPEWHRAFDSHPRIGESKAKAATAQSAAWSAGEQQSAAASTDDNIAARLAAGNRAYEQKFGRIFLICASGKTAAEILDALGRRLGNDADIELLEAVEQQRQITRLRLQKWLAAPPQP